MEAPQQVGERIDNGRLAIVAGAGGDIGKLVMDELGDQGYTLIVTGRGSSVDALSEHIQEKGYKGHAAHLDFTEEGTNYDEWYRDQSGIYQKHASRLVLASGITEDRSVDDTGRSDMRRLFSINAEGPVALANVVSKYMSEAEDPSMIALSSIAGRGRKHLQAYGMSKAALETGVIALGVERGVKVRANALNLDYVAGTTMWDKEEPVVRKAAARKMDERGELTPDLVAQRVVRIMDSPITRKIITLSHLKEPQDLRHMSWEEFEAATAPKKTQE